MIEVANVTEPRLTRPSTQRVRRYRERRREGLRLLTLEMPETAIDAAVARGFLKPEDSTLAWSVIQSVYANQLSDRALNWLTDNGAYQRGCDPPLHQQLGGAGGSTIRRE